MYGVHVLKYKVQGLGFGVGRIQASNVWGLHTYIQGSGLRVWGLGFRVFKPQMYGVHIPKSKV